MSRKSRGKVVECPICNGHFTLSNSNFVTKNKDYEIEDFEYEQMLADKLRENSIEFGGRKR